MLEHVDRFAQNAAAADDAMGTIGELHELTIASHIMTASPVKATSSRLCTQHGSTWDLFGLIDASSCAASERLGLSQVVDWCTGGATQGTEFEHFAQRNRFRFRAG